MRKFKCIESYRSGTYFTKDKIYELNDKTMIFDSGEVYTTLDEVSTANGLKIIGNYLIEIKEKDKKVREFKVGDRVKILDGTKKVGWTSSGSMNKYIGTHGKIISIHDNGTSCSFNILLELDNMSWLFKKEDIELYTSSNKKSIHITTEGTTTNAVLKDGKEIIKRASVGLYHKDEYKFETGVIEVVKKLFGEKEDEHHVTTTLKDLLSLYSSSELLDELKRRMEK